MITITLEELKEMVKKMECLETTHIYVDTLIERNSKMRCMEIGEMTFYACNDKGKIIDSVWFYTT